MMECDWEYKEGFEHQKMIDDGTLNASANQQVRLFGELQDNTGSSKLAGEVAHPPEVAASPSASSSRGEAATPLEVPAAQDADDEDDEDQQGGLRGLGTDALSMLDMLSPAKVAAMGASPSTKSAGRAAAAAKAKAGFSAMPPPLRPPPRNAGSRSSKPRGGEQVAPASACGSSGRSASPKAAADIDGLLQKGVGIVRQFEGSERHVFAHDRDKLFYKNVANLQRALEGKVHAADAARRDQITSLVKHLGIVVSITKAYKSWIRKGDDVAYDEEKTRIEQFCKEAPLVELSLPKCLLMDEAEMLFGASLTPLLESRDKDAAEAMAARWARIGLDEIQALGAASEAAAYQKRVVEGCLVKLLSSSASRPGGEGLTELLEQVVFILSPVTPTARFRLDDAVVDDIGLLKGVFDFDGYADTGAHAISDKIQKVERSDSQLCKVFSSMSVGAQLLRLSKSRLQEQVQAESSQRRLTELLKAVGEPCKASQRVEHMVAMEQELASLSNKNLLHMAPETANDALLQIATDELGRMWRVILEVRNRIKKPGQAGEVKMESGRVTEEFADLLATATRMQSMTYLAKQSELIGQSAALLEAFAKAPLLLLTGSSKNHPALDVAVFEDLACFLSYLARFIKGPDGKTPKADVLGLLGESVEQVAGQITALHTLGCSVLAGAEERCVPSKLSTVLPIMYADSDFWASIRNADASKEFVLENKAITEHMCMVMSVMSRSAYLLA
jgi:hypothetical protein